MSDGSLSLTVEMTCGGNTNNRDNWKAKAEADDVEELDEKVRQLRERFEEWALEFREIQPLEKRPLSEDQAELGEVKA